jgi:C4-type Zn-finger protein
MRLHLLEGLLATSQERVELLESEKIASYKAFTNLLKIEQQKYEAQKEITVNMESWGNSWRDQSAYYEKKDRKHRRQKKGLIAGIVILIGVLVVK